eukprot:NODE_7_length_48057_cov_0.322240.p24 type:complete len:149 gc:universal NODE_7_length_48057_cov_0.322240:7147-7593(+)
MSFSGYWRSTCLAYVYAILADSFITCFKWPVICNPPFLWLLDMVSIILSMYKVHPPKLVHASPITTPGTRYSYLCSLYFGIPRYLANKDSSIVIDGYSSGSVSLGGERDGGTTIELLIGAATGASLSSLVKVTSLIYSCPIFSRDFHS